VEELLKLSETTCTPVFNSPKFSGGIPYRHPFRAGGAANLASLMLAKSPKRPDLITLVGARAGFLLGGRGGSIIPNEDCKLVQIDIDSSEIGRSHHVNVGIVSDARRALEALNAEIGARPFKCKEEWIRSALNLKKMRTHNDEEPVIDTENGKLHPYHAIKKVFNCLPHDSIVCIDGGEVGGWSLQLLEEAHASLSLVTTGYLGFLGNGWGYSLGAAVADPSRLVLNVQGDGSAGFHIAELDTYARFGLEIITLIVNNSVWGMSQAGQDLIYGGHTDKRPAARLNPNTKYEMVAEGFGCASARVDSRFAARRGSLFADDSKVQKAFQAIDAAMDELVHTEGPGLLNLIVSDKPYQDTTVAMVGCTDDPHVIVVPYYDNLPRPYYKQAKQNGGMPEEVTS